MIAFILASNINIKALFLINASAATLKLNQGLRASSVKYVQWRIQVAALL